MKVIKIIVDEKPKTCIDCPLKFIDVENKIIICNITSFYCEYGELEKHCPIVDLKDIE